MGWLFGIYAFATIPFLQIATIVALISLAYAEMLPKNISFLLNMIDPDSNSISDFFVLIQTNLYENFFTAAFFIFLFTSISLLYVRYRIAGSKVVALGLLLFYILNLLCFCLCIFKG